MILIAAFAFASLAVAAGFFLVAVAQLTKAIRAHSPQKFWVGAWYIVASAVSAYVADSFLYVGADQVALLESRIAPQRIALGRNVALPGEMGWRADMLGPGWHAWCFRWFRSVKKIDGINVPLQHVGVVVALEAGPPVQSPRPLSAADIYDATRFLTGGWQRGVQPVVLEVGKHAANPLVFAVRPIPTYDQSYYFGEGGEVSRGEGAIGVSTKEGARLLVDLAVTFRIDPKDAPTYYQRILELGASDNYAKGEMKHEEQVRSAVRAVVRAQTKQFSAVELEPNRTALAQAVKTELATELAVEGITVVRVDIREFISRLPEHMTYKDFVDRHVEGQLAASSSAQDKLESEAMRTKQRLDFQTQMEAQEHRMKLESASLEADRLRLSATLDLEKDRWKALVEAFGQQGAVSMAMVETTLASKQRVVPYVVGGPMTWPSLFGARQAKEVEPAAEEH